MKTVNSLIEYLTFALVVGCRHPAQQSTPIANTQPRCPHAVQRLVVAQLSKEKDDHEPFLDADSDARADYARARAAAANGRMRDAARHYLDCAGRYQDVADEDPGGATALHNAHACYWNSIQAFEMAGRFIEEGRDALLQAAKEDRRNAEFVHIELAKVDPDCPPQ